MDKRLLITSVIVLLCLTGCDFFRGVAGRPKSEELEKKKIEILRLEQAREQARLDSLRVQQQIVKDSLARLDSLAILDSLRQLGGTILNPSSLGGLFSTKLEARYYIIVGSFRSRENAEKLLNRVSNQGYPVSLINFKNGLMAVGVCPANNLKDAHNALASVKSKRFCPKDVWILVNE